MTDKTLLPDYVAEDEELVNTLRSFSRAYPEDIFLPLTDEQTKEHALVITRASAAMGRHVSTFMARGADTIERLHARIDALMLEYCPDDMTEEQKDRWAEHQRAVPR